MESLVKKIRSFMYNNIGKVGFIRRRRFLKEAVDIYLEEDTGTRIYDGERGIRDFYFRCGVANAINALGYRLGFDIPHHVIKERVRRKRKNEK